MGLPTMVQRQGTGRSSQCPKSLIERRHGDQLACRPCRPLQLGHVVDGHQEHGRADPLGRHHLVGDASDRRHRAVGEDDAGAGDRAPAGDVARREDVVETRARTSVRPMARPRRRWRSPPGTGTPARSRCPAAGRGCRPQARCPSDLHVVGLARRANRERDGLVDRHRVDRPIRLLELVEICEPSTARIRSPENSLLNAGQSGAVPWIRAPSPCSFG